jgi:multidrug transporter EmrE-like cation transporter
MNKFALGLITLAVFFEVIGDVLFKYWSINSKTTFIVIGVLIYSIGTIIWAYSLKFDLLSKQITIFTVLNLIAVVLVGFFLFKEEVSIVNMIGITLGVISVILVQL